MNKNPKELLIQLKNGVINVEDLMLHHKDKIQQSTNLIFQGNQSFIEEVIRLCLDYYTYSEIGGVLISDNEYDKLMQIWVSIGNAPIIYPDHLPSYSSWPLKKHSDPGMVGSIGKIYTEDELINYLSKYRGIERWIVAPKYDGVSGTIDMVDETIVSGLTRGDGFEGQDITNLIRHAKNSRDFFNGIEMSNQKEGQYKCELVMSQEDFDTLIKEKQYANRRSATSGIINTPKNISLAKYITIIPLLQKQSNGIVVYNPPGMKLYSIPVGQPLLDTVEFFTKKITKMLAKIRHSSFPYRTDGVILFPYINAPYNESDIMQDAIAFKVNTSEAITTVDYGYVSLGRLGNAVPMLRVHPVEVNETIVTDVSMSSFDKFEKMALRAEEDVIVYSAGDVIPMIRLPEKRKIDKTAPFIDIPKVCPYCENKLKRFGLMYRCVNEMCPRLITGVISNFLVKIGADDISDKTIEALYENKIISNIVDVFRMEYDDIVTLPGFGPTSATNIIEEIDRIKNKEIQISEFFGALGIPNISEKKCRNIFVYVTVKDVLNLHSKKLRHKILDAENIGIKTANAFVEYIDDNKAFIKELMSHLNVVENREYIGNVVFTGFRNPDLARRFDELDVELSDNINSKTLAVISGDYNHESTKAKAAKRQGITIVDLIDIEDMIKTIKKGNLNKFERMF